MFAASFSRRKTDPGRVAVSPTSLRNAPRGFATDVGLAGRCPSLIAGKQASGRRACVRRLQTNTTLSKRLRMTHA